MQKLVRFSSPYVFTVILGPETCLEAGFLVLAMPTLRDVAERWECIASVRTRARRTRTLLFRAGELPHANVKQCGKHRDIMAPLVRAVKASPLEGGKLGMFTIHQVECE